MRRRFANVSLFLVLLASVFGMVVASATSNIGLSFVAMASTEGGGGNEDNNSNEGNNDEGEDRGGGDEDTSEPEPQPEPSPEPVPTPEPVPEPVPPVTELTGKPVIECPEGTVLNDVDECEPLPDGVSSYNPPPGCEGLDPLECLGKKIGVPPPECDNLTPLECLELELNKPVPPTPPISNLPICDGTPRDCITPNGDICLVGQGGHECECAEDMSDCQLHPSLPPPFESPSPKPLPYCHKVPDDYQGACHDILDYDEETGLYPCNDGTQEEDWKDCPDAYVPPPKPCDPATDPHCQEYACPAVIGTDCKPGPKCDEGYELVDGKCVPKKDKPKCPPGWEYREKQDDCYKEIEIIINKIIKETNEGKHKDGFPEVDIIGLSVKQDGDAMICAMNIDNGWVQCQEFGMDPNRVNSEFWRIIEVDQDKDYDNGNTGSSNVDLAIEDIKNHDFDELDDDRDNHDFGIDLAWVAINPQGEGVTCLTTDQSGKGKSLCEPFKVSAQDVSGQITEGVEFS